MSEEYSYGRQRKTPRKSVTTRMRPPVRRGTLATGRIVRLLVGQGHGFIRVSDDREIYFHRADMQEGTSIGDLDVGDMVTFELFDDRVSGARGLRVRRYQQQR
jgi:cold shock CspA family protein